MQQLNTTRCGETPEIASKNRREDTFVKVKKPLKKGQSAWVTNPSETKRSAFQRGNTKYCASQQDFEWIVGVTDGDGTFYFGMTPKGYWTFTFKVGQSSYNLRLLYHIKNIVGVGSVSVCQDSMAEYRVRDIQHIVQYVLPIFDSFPLLTTKHFQYTNFKKAILIINDPDISREEKNKLIFITKNDSRVIPVEYISPVWDKVKLNSKSSVIEVISKNWIVGFTEAEGSFYIVKKGPQRIGHGFEITQKFDIIVLEAISIILDIQVYQKRTYNTVVVQKREKLITIIRYFCGTIKGIKSLEYKIWARSILKKDQSFEKLNETRNLIRSIRSIRLNKHFKIL